MLHSTGGPLPYHYEIGEREYFSVDPLGRRTTRTFDARSLATQRTDGKGQVETRLYDALGRQTGSQYGDGTIITLTFDLLGRKLTEANQNGTWTRTYDALGQRLTELGPGYPSGMALTSPCDAVGQRTALQCWRGVQTWGYDAIHRPRTLVDVEGGLYTWSYEPHGRLQELDYPNGVIFSVTYGGNGWPYQASYSSSADSQIDLLVYDVFDNGINPLRVTDYWGGTLQNRRNLTYDAADQMTHWEDSDTRGPLTVFDPAGNPSTAQVNNGAYVYTYTYDGADECVNQAETQPGDVFFTSATFSYDGAGQRIGEQYYQLSATNGPSIGLTTYTWDAPGHLLKIQQTNTGAVNLTNSYRPDGLRHQRTDNNGTTQMIWDGDDVLAQVDLSGNLIEAWSWAPPLPGANWSRLVKNRFPTTNAHPDQYVHSDWRGTVQALSLPNGSALARNGAGPRAWGEGDSGACMPLCWQGNHGYWSEYQLARPLHYVRARWYMDGNGWSPPGWLSPDPLGFGGGDANLYRYVGNRPSVRVDPSGLWDQVSVHLLKTIQWAQEVYVPGGPDCPYIVFSAPGNIGEGAASEDDIFESAFNPSQWHVHFNFDPHRRDPQGRTDITRMMNALSLNGYPDTRDLFYASQLKAALSNLPKGGYLSPALNSRACTTGMTLFGAGLHAIEDEYSHTDLSPAEHQDRTNEPFVDDPNYFREEVLAIKTFYSTKYPALNALFGTYKVRAFLWTRDTSQPRLKATEARVKSLLCQFLRQLVSENRGCVKCSCNALGRPVKPIRGQPC